MILKLQNINFTNYAVNQASTNRRDNSISKPTLNSIPFMASQTTVDEALKNSLFDLIGMINKLAKDDPSLSLTGLTAKFSDGIEAVVHRNCKNKGAVLLEVRKNGFDPNPVIALSRDCNRINSGNEINLDEFVETLKGDNPDLDIETMAALIKQYFSPDFLNYIILRSYSWANMPWGLAKYRTLPDFNT